MRDVAYKFGIVPPNLGRLTPMDCMFQTNYWGQAATCKGLNHTILKLKEAKGLGV